MYNQLIGKYGEDVVIPYLKKNQYQILVRNFRCKQGEIDVIAKEKEELVFIEVKARSSSLYGNPIDGVNRKKQKCLYRSAQYFLYKYHLEKEAVRFDVIGIYIKNQDYKMNHIKNVEYF